MPVVGITGEGRAASDIRHTRGPVADLPIDLGGALNERLARCLDIEGKIPRALEALGPVSGRDVLLVGTPGGLRQRQLADLGARVRVAPDSDQPLSAQGDGSVDVVVGMWTSFRGAAPAEVREAQRVARLGGRLLVLHDYGRDDVSRLRGDLPEYGSWSHRSGPFLGSGFHVRVIHCFWTFESIDDATDFLAAAFGDTGREVARSMTRPRLSYNVAVYHRDIGAKPDGPRTRVDA
jgi:hypothetical protein